jgi:hypothetical protein
MHTPVVCARICTGVCANAHASKCAHARTRCVRACLRAYASKCAHARTRCVRACVRVLVCCVCAHASMHAHVPACVCTHAKGRQVPTPDSSQSTCKAAEPHASTLRCTLPTHPHCTDALRVWSQPSLRGVHHGIRDRTVRRLPYGLPCCAARCSRPTLSGCGSASPRWTSTATGACTAVLCCVGSCIARRPRRMHTSVHSTRGTVGLGRCACACMALHGKLVRHAAFRRGGLGSRWVRVRGRMGRILDSATVAQRPLGPGRYITAAELKRGLGASISVQVRSPLSRATFHSACHTPRHLPYNMQHTPCHLAYRTHHATRHIAHTMPPGTQHATRHTTFNMPYNVQRVP